MENCYVARISEVVENEMYVSAGDTTRSRPKKGSPDAVYSQPIKSGENSKGGESGDVYAVVNPNKKGTKNILVYHLISKISNYKNSTL